MLVSGGSSPYSWTLEAGSLPDGVTLNPLTGAISGTPLNSGSYSFTVQAADTNQLTTQQYTIVVASAGTQPAVNTLVTPDGIVGQPYTTPPAESAGTQYAWSVATGALPPGLSLSSANGVISGTPSQAGNFAFTVTAASGSALVSTQNLTITVLAATIQITTVSPLPNATIGQTYSQQFNASGGSPPYHWSLTSGDSSVYSIDPVTGVLSGTPENTGTATFSVAVTDSAQNFGTAAFAVTAAQATIQITSSSSLQGTVGQSFSAILNAPAAVAPLNWTLVSGQLPPGISLNSATGALTGTPTTAGSYAFTVQVTDSNGRTATQELTAVITVASLTITTTSLPSATASGTYSQTIGVTGGVGPYMFTSSGTLPGGVSLNASTGQLSGTPTVPGTFSFSITATDSTGAAVTQSYTLTVAAPSLGAVSISGLSGTITPGEQVQINLNLASPYPIALTGTASVTLASSVALQGNTTDLTFSNGEQMTNFSLAAGATQVTIPLQAGTVEGTVTFSFTLSASQVDVTPPNATSSAQISADPPAITVVTPSVSGSTIQIAVTGFSDTRELQSASFTFSPAAGSNLKSSQFTVDVNSIFSSWYSQTSSFALGGQFLYTQPFSIGGSANSIDSVTVTLTNSAGASQAMTVAVP